MSRTGTKPRWEAWENACVEKAFQEKIQLKVIALGLRRTLSSVSKKIKVLGLRESQSKQRYFKRSKERLTLLEKTDIDRRKMNKIIETHAPLSLRENRDMLLKTRFWSANQPSAIEVNHRVWKGSLEKQNASFSYSYPLDYILSKDLMPKHERNIKTYGNPYYVSLEHVEAWAASEGFQRMEKGLHQKGLTYWKEGKYFSQTQLLIYVNRIRQEKQLQPLTLFENDEAFL